MKKSKYKYTENCREISGFSTHTFFGISGKGYEDACKEMVIRGMEWFDTHPKAEPVFKTFKNIYGLIVEDNDEAKEVVAHMTKDMDATGAMVQACVNHLLQAHRGGWEQYIKDLEKQKCEEDERTNK